MAADIFAKVLKIFNEYDPMCFYVTAGIYPKDEYEIEAMDLVELIEAHYVSLDVHGMRLLVRRVVSKNFGTTSNRLGRNEYTDIAEALVKTLFKE